MPKTSAIERNKKRIKLAAKHAAKRAELKATLANPAATDDEFYAAQKKLQKLPRNSSPVRIRNRCSMSGRPRAYIRKFGVSRITFRELALAGKIPGVVKSLRTHFCHPERSEGSTTKAALERPLGFFAALRMTRQRNLSHLFSAGSRI